MRLSEENCVERTGFPLSYFLELTGIYGIYHDFHLDTHALDFDIQLDDNRVEIDIETKDLENFQRTIIPDKKIIKNILLVKKKGCTIEHIGIKLISSQIQYATKADYKFLKINAYKEMYTKEKPVYVGYSVWAPFGFHMEEDDYKDFISLMRQHGLDEIKTLNQLVSTEEGKNKWNSIGIKWAGYFDLSTNSDSIRTFESYKLKKLKNYI